MLRTYPLGVRIPKSTLHYWEVRHGEIEYDYSVVDSKKFTDWLKGLHEIFIDVRVRWSSLKGYLRGGGVMLGDGAFNSKPVLNTIASKGYIPIVKRARSPRGYGARIRYRAYDESLYAYRGVGEGIFGALTVKFGDRLKTRRKEPTKTRTPLRIIIYCLKILIQRNY